MAQGVYFVQASSGGPVKIGYSADIPTRLNDLQRQCPVQLICLGTISPVSVAVERFLHDHFAEYRLHGEWFAPEPDLIQFAQRRNHDDLLESLAPNEVAEGLGIGVDEVRSMFQVFPIGSRGGGRVLKVDYDEVAQRVCEARVRRLVKMTLKRTLERLGPIAEELIQESLDSLSPSCTACDNLYENSPDGET